MILSFEEFYLRIAMSSTTFVTVFTNTRFPSRDFAIQKGLVSVLYPGIAKTSVIKSFVVPSIHSIFWNSLSLLKTNANLFLLLVKTGQ